MTEDTIIMAHGSGGEATERLISEIFRKAFDNPYLAKAEDASILPASQEIALTTDSFVVTPPEFPGGDIGRLAVCGTVNDLVTSGAVPKYLTAGFILQDGLSVELLKRVVISMAETAAEAGVQIVTGDTKVVEGGPEGGILINTAGVGFADPAFRPEGSLIAEGDVLILSGSLGDHHAAILAKRMGLSSDSINSDVAPLTGMASKLRTEKVTVHAMRDVTRGGLATVLNEYCRASSMSMVIKEEAIVVHESVRDFCGILGLDPLYMGNEGKMLFVVPKEEAQRTLTILHESPYGKEAVLIGEVQGKVPVGEAELLYRTRLGGIRVLGPLYGEGLPRIC